MAACPVTAACCPPATLGFFLHRFGTTSPTSQCATKTCPHAGHWKDLVPTGMCSFLPHPLFGQVPSPYVRVFGTRTPPGQTRSPSLIRTRAAGLLHIRWAW